LPTPASPISTALFLRRRARISIVCSISSARPITGSMRPSAASAVEVAAELVERGGRGLRLGRGGVRGRAAGGGDGEELARADLAQGAGAAATLGREHDAHAARPLAAVRADGEAVAREVRGGVHGVRLLSKSELGRLRLAASFHRRVMRVTECAATRRMR
jgi:hypothetical protein